MLFEAFVGPALPDEPEVLVLEMGHLKNILEGRPMEISSDVLNMLPDPASKGTVVKAMASRSLMLIDEAEAEVRNMELTKKSSETALRNADKIIKDRDHFRDQALADANSQRYGLVEKIAQLENAKKLLKAECSSLKEKNHELELNMKEAVKAGVENFQNQTRQVLAELKEFYPTVDISSIKADFPAPEDVGDVAAQLPPMDHRLGHFPILAITAQTTKASLCGKCTQTASLEEKVIGNFSLYP
ncbi:hypothetical protein Fot_32719 [Forsythia ovata]|uniref:Uncharacterized protein n=1 Tax=Forsythia ovata TaxID=205694 RepID=A0ABD1T8M5_9LAMI